MEKAKNFYGNLFDWKISGGENKDWAYWLIDTGEKPTGVLVYILMDDIDKTLENVVKLGGKLSFQSRGKKKTLWQPLQT